FAVPFAGHEPVAGVLEYQALGLGADRHHAARAGPCTRHQVTARVGGIGSPHRRTAPLEQQHDVARLVQPDRRELAAGNRHAAPADGAVPLGGRSVAADIDAAALALAEQERPLLALAVAREDADGDFAVRTAFLGALS